MSDSDQWQCSAAKGRATAGLLVCQLVVTAVLTGCASQSAAEPEAKRPLVTVATPVRKQIVEWDEYTGRMEAIDFVEVRSRVSGYLQTIHFDEGQVVQAGDLLFVVDPRPYQAELNAAQARLAEAESKLEQSRSQLREAKARQLKTKAELQLAETNVKRARSLKQRSALSQDELDQREAELLQAQAEAEGSQASISSAEAAIQTSTAAIETAKAGVETAQLNLNYTRILAPVAGRISHKYVTEGNLISGGTASSTLLTTITSVNPIHCSFDASEQDVLKYIRLHNSGDRESSRDVKNPVFLALLDETGYPHKGHMDFVDNRFDPNTATMRARCIFPNDDQVLFPGMFARIRIPGSAAYTSVLIPDSAVGTDQSDQFVYIVVNGIIERRKVTLGPLVDGLRVVRTGLKGDESLVIEGLLQTRPEMEVETKEGTITAEEDGLPDSYSPLPPEEWLSPGPDKAVGQISSPAEAKGEQP